jgi:secondary thiamine-phosphate synthase enzyme
MQKFTLSVSTHSKGLYPITPQINELIAKSGVREGMCFLFIQHTSASLTISESYDPTAKLDLEEFMERLAPENLSWYKHTLEGPDDSTSHMRAILTSTSESIPIENGRLFMGTWQGVYLFEHRTHPHRRNVVIRILSTDGDNPQ